MNSLQVPQRSLMSCQEERLKYDDQVVSLKRADGTNIIHKKGYRI